LAARLPDRHAWLVGGALQQYGLVLSGLGRHDEARRSYAEALSFLRPSAAEFPGRHLPTLAVALGNLGISLTQSGSVAEAIVTLQEAAALERRLLAENPAASRMGITIALNELGEGLLALGRHGEARRCLLEAVELLGADGHPPLAAYYQLASTLEVLGRVHRALEDPALGLATQAEAVAHWSALARLRPEAFAARYAEQQTALAQAFADKGHPPGAALVAERDAAERWGIDPS
jgi:tetratricopeptide (TPR) repeat protein